MQEVMKMIYILVEMGNTSSISSPLKTTNRIKFLSFAASEKFIVFGATSGGLYVYNRESFTFKSLVPSKEGSVTCVMISPDEKWFGFSTARGVSCVLEHNGSAVNRRILSHVHEGRKVTALQWNDSSSQLYIGDDSGQISVLSISSYLTPAVALMQLDSSVIQLDTCSYMLLASTTTRSYLCDTFREQYRQIGSRLREGEFGGCFYPVESYERFIDPKGDSSDRKDSHGPFSSMSDGEWLLSDTHLQNVKLFCARPGLRLWEVRIDGAVLSTHQFKQLQVTPPTSVIQPPAVGLSETPEMPQQKCLVQFSKLFKVSNKFILTYDCNGLCVLDPMTSEIILWTDQFKNIVDLCVVGEILYLWMGDSKLHAVSLTPIDKFLVQMYLQKKYSYCARLCAAHVNGLKKLAHISLKMHILVDLLEKIAQEDKAEEDLLDESTLITTRHLLDEVSRNAQTQGQAQMLNSGIFIVGNAHLLSQKEELGIRRPQHHPSVKLDANDSMVDFFPNFLRKQDSQSQDSSRAEKDTLNGVFIKSILPSISSLSLSEQSNINSNEDCDPFPDMPLSSLTSTETIMALKNLTSSVSGTLMNGTKSLKEKWQNLEEKLRGQEESGLSVEKRINHPDNESANSSESNYEEEKVMVVGSKKILPKLPVSSFMDKCSQVACFKGDSQKNLLDLEFEMLSSFALLYKKFMQSSASESEKFGSDLLEEFVPSSGFEKWLNNRDVVPFPFYHHFEKEFVTTLRRLFYLSLKSGSLMKWVSQFIPFIKLDYDLFPSAICRIHSKESLLKDQALGRTLEMFKVLLDPHSALQCLDESGSFCQYFSWNVIMDAFRTCAVSTSHTTEEGSHTWPLPRVLNAMLVMLQLGQIESCWNIGKHVPIKHVFRTVLKLGTDLPQIYNLFLLYLEKIPEETLEAILEDYEVYCFSRIAYESLHESGSHLQCSCGFPLSDMKYPLVFSQVGRTLLSHINKTRGPSEALSFCQKTGVLWNHLLVLRREDPIEQVLPLILHTASVEQLKNRCSELSSSMWGLVFQLRGKLQEGYCLHCDSQLNGEFLTATMSWAALASLLLTEVDVEFALSLLSKHSHLIPAGSLSKQFYQSCLLASVAENQNPGLKEGLLEALADCRAVPVMSPHLAGKLGIPHGQDRHHWGLQVQLSESHCLSCLLPLASVSAGSVVSFRCRHSFHLVCLQQQHLQHCPICIKE